MFKFVKKSTAVVMGLGASLILGRWLKKREEETTLNTSSTSTPMASTATKAEMPAPDVLEEIKEIPLPASAFEGIEEVEQTKSSSNGNGATKPKAKVETPKKEAKPAPAAKSKEATEPADFTEITGIGAKTAETLQGMDIMTFADLAQADAATIKEQVTRASLAKIKGWIADAKKRSNA